jgi:sulfotransferase family protein
MGNTFAIKTHSGPTPMARRLIANGQMRVTYIYRDPRAALLSAIEYGQRSREADRSNAFSRLGTFELAIEFMLDYLRIWQQWMKVEGIHTLRYEDLLVNYDAEAERLARFLDADPAIPAVKEAIEFYRSEKDRKGQHFQHGEAERFRTALTAEELAKANKAFAAYLVEMKYEV